METLGSRIRTARGKLSQEAFANLIQVSKGSLGFYERDENLPNTDVVLKICSTTGVRIEWLLTGEGPMHGGSIQQERPGTPLLVAPQSSDDINVVWINRLKARLSAGGGSFEVETECNGKFAFRSDWIHRKGRPEAMVLMEVSGDSMAPDICDKDMVLIDQSQHDLVSGGIFAIGVEETIMVKELDVEPGILLIRSKNKAYETIRIPRGSDIERSVRIIGRVIWWCREVR